jgi:hypothetical protein
MAKGPEDPFIFKNDRVFGTHEDRAGVSRNAFSMRDAVWGGQNNFVTTPLAMETALTLYSMMVEPGYDSCAPLCPDSRLPLATEESGAHKDIAFMAARMSPEDRRDTAQWLYDGIQKGLQREQTSTEKASHERYKMEMAEARGDIALTAAAEKHQREALVKSGPLKARLMAVAGGGKVNSFLFDYGDADKDEPVLHPPVPTQFYTLSEDYRGPYDSDKRRTYFHIQQGEKAADLFLHEKVEPTSWQKLAGNFGDNIRSTGNGPARVFGIVLGMGGIAFRNIVGLKNKDHNISDRQALRAVAAHHLQASLQSGKAMGGVSMIKSLHDLNAPSVVPSMGPNPSKFNPALLPESGPEREALLGGMMVDLQTAVEQKDEKRVFQTSSRIRHYADLCSMVPPHDKAGADINPAIAAYFHRVAKFETAGIKNRVINGDFDAAGKSIEKMVDKKEVFFSDAHDEIKAKQTKDMLEKTPVHELLRAELRGLREGLANVQHTAAVAAHDVALGQRGYPSEGFSN